MNTDQYVWLTKYNPYHGKDGKFTSGGGAKTTVPDSHTSAKKIMAASTTEARTHSSASAGKTTAKPKKRRKPKAPVPQTTNAEDIANCTFLRKDPPPRNTRKAYKVFFTKNGKLYPPMVANPGGAPTPFGVWLDAREGEKAGTSKTGRPQVKQGGKGTQGGRVDDLAQLGLPSSGTFEKSYSLFSEINKSADVKVRHAWFRNGRNE